MNLSFYLAFPLMAILAILQSTLLPRFPVLGVVPQLWFVATITWTLMNGLRQGLIWALIGGIFVDLFSASPLGVTTLAMMAAVSLVVFVKRHFPESRILMPVVLGVIASLVFWFVYLLLLRIVIPLTIDGYGFLGISNMSDNSRIPDLLGDIASGYSPAGPILTYILITSFIHGFLILPIYWGFSNLERLFSRKRVEI
jgi:rod shape-determining protein MreD